MNLFLTDHFIIFGNVQNISFGAKEKKLIDCFATSEAVISVCATLTWWPIFRSFATFSPLIVITFR